MAYSFTNEYMIGRKDIVAFKQLNANEFLVKCNAIC